MHLILSDIITSVYLNYLFQTYHWLSLHYPECRMHVGCHPTDTCSSQLYIMYRLRECDDKNRRLVPRNNTEIYSCSLAQFSNHLKQVYISYRCLVSFTCFRNFESGTRINISEKLQCKNLKSNDASKQPKSLLDELVWNKIRYVHNGNWQFQRKRIRYRPKFTSLPCTQATLHTHWFFS